MRTGRMGWAILFGLASAVAVVGFRWQALGPELAATRARTETLQQEVERERTRQLELKADVTAPDELARLRNEHEVIVGLRSDLATLQQKQATAAVVSEPPKTEPAVLGIMDSVVPPGAWKNAGQTTPQATAETALWAAAAGDVDRLAAMIELTPDARVKALAVLDRLSPEQREQFGTPERLVAMLTAKDVPTGGAAITNRPAVDGEYTGVSLELQNAEGARKNIGLPMHRVADTWQILVMPNVVENYGAKLLGHPPPFAELPWRPRPKE